MFAFANLPCFGRPTAFGPRGRGRAEIVQNAFFAARPPGDADPPAVQDQPQRQPSPFLFRHHRANLVLDLDRVACPHQAQAVSQSRHVAVDRETWHAEPDAEDYVGGLATDTWKLDEVLQGVRHDAAEQLDHSPARVNDPPGLQPKETGRLDQLLDLYRIGGSEVGGRRIALEHL